MKKNLISRKEVIGMLSVLPLSWKIAYGSALGPLISLLMMVVKDFPAISRRDNKTKICPTCGTAEALEDLLIFSCLLKGVKKW